MTWVAVYKDTLSLWLVAVRKRLNGKFPEVRRYFDQWSLSRVATTSTGQDHSVEDEQKWSAPRNLA